jgi:methylated-DNA-[protein]-cysteine S-methyltransferase
MNLVQWSMRSKVGPLYLVASKKGLRAVSLRKQDAPMARSLRGAAPELRVLSRAAGQLAEYLAGKRKKFDLPFDVNGTSFQKHVWKELSRIPYGRTCSYRDVAARIKNAKAMRAVGSANGKNPLCIVVPCHRVIAADGSIGGYSGGLPVKRKLLELERNRLS